LRDIVAHDERARTAPPDRSWIEFDVGLRNQDPAAIERKVIEHGD
jgi:hypothetical protein